ncbi:NADPH-dependent F420 reductase [Glaciihabitans sp. dw_435]|uniref:NADPH-dependent F420 reductase n=1 Tax=Glaciihabitans sp. dw_435 TaxID=2720081 RepID=UPI001BD3FAA9|nr:NAD(P)-binding domain-containing protein [Glaciihabitans sp. dw_435]
MTSVTVFGSGKMGSAIGSIFTAGGATVDHITSSTPDATVTGDIVVFAVPYGAIGDIVAKHRDQLAGKIVVDITNPIDFSTFTFVVPADGSGANEIAKLLPASTVVKGFNTTFAQTLADPSRGAVVLIAGDNADAKATVLAAIQAGGFAAVDTGALAAARELEGFAKLQIQLAMGGKIGGFAVIPAA